MRFIGVLLPSLGLGLAAACADPESVPDADDSAWERFVADNAQPMPDGSYIFQGDVHVSAERLRAMFDAAQLSATFGAVRHDVWNGEYVWNAAERLELTYCIQNDFGSPERNKRVADALMKATNDWERASDVNYIWIDHADGAGCEDGVNGIVFEVRLGTAADCSTLGCLTSWTSWAFSPHDFLPQELLVWPLAFDKTTSELERMMRHELGHTLGLFHEHAQFEQDGAPEECVDMIFDDFRALTPPDSRSVMGYEQCNGIADNNYQLSAYDRLGLRYLYGLPRRFGRPEVFSFTGGPENDLFWFVPGGTWSLFEPDDNDTIAFTSTNGCQYHDNDCDVPIPEDAIPFAAQWRTDYWAEHVFLYGRGDDPDLVLQNGMPEQHGMLPHAVNLKGFTVPLTGRFHDGGAADGRSDIFWYHPGTADEAFWHPGVPQTEPTVDGYYDPIVGGFGALNGPDEIVWRDPVAATGFVWTSDGNDNFSSTVVDFGARGLAPNREYIPIYGEFDDDGQADILWYAPGPTADVLWHGDGTMASGVTTEPLQINGYYKPIAADFTQDGTTDILWYQPGPAADVLWIFTPHGVEQSYLFIDGDYSPIAGNFNTDDLCADILWYRPEQDMMIPWRSNCDGTFTAQNPIPVPADAFPVGYALGR